MGKKLIIIGADFSNNAIPARNVHTVGELLTYKGFIQIVDGTSLSQESRPTGAWRCAILQLQPNMYIENAPAVSAEGNASAQVPNKIPPIAFLSSGSISGFIQGSQRFVPSGSSTGFFAKFSGMLNPPSGATHVVINTNLDQGGSETATISWD